jgi:hypothetical protein
MWSSTRRSASEEVSEFFRSKINYLGHVISTEGIQPNPDKVQAILNKRSPTIITELRTWQGMMGFYRQYIPRFEAITAPLFAMIHVGERFRWSVEEEDIFLILFYLLDEIDFKSYFLNYL